jgi:hypothetical protein
MIATAPLVAVRLRVVVFTGIILSVQYVVDIVAEKEDGFTMRFCV